MFGCEMLNVFVLCAEKLQALVRRKWLTLPQVTKNKQNLQTLPFAVCYISRILQHLISRRNSFKVWWRISSCIYLNLV